MENFFDLTVKENVLERINKLTSENKAMWGTMNVNQMMCHLADQLRLALGVRQSPLEGSVLFKTQLGIFMALYIVPWRKGKEVSPTVMDKNKEGTPSKGFDRDKEELMNLLNQFFNSKEGSLHPHPLFGKLTHRQWGRMLAKHANHHLKQFGV